MYKNLIFFLCILIPYFLFLETSCTSEQLKKPPILEFCDTLQVSYELQVKEIIDTNCAFAGCHIAGSTAPGNYTSYNSMSPFLKDNVFKRFVVDLKNDPERGMPPNWETNPGPKDLTEEEFNIVSCWIEEGYPEN